MTRPLVIPRLKSAEYDVRQLVVTAEAGDSIDDILKPEYWAIVARNLQVGDEITVRTDDELFYAKLLVRQVGPVWAKVHLLSYTDLQPKDVTAEVVKPQFTVEWGGQHHKYRVRRTSDNAVVSSGHADKETANNWTAEHMKAIA